MTFSLKHNELLSCSVALGRICDLHAYRCTKKVLDFLTEQCNSRTCIVVTIFFPDVGVGSLRNKCPKSLLLRLWPEFAMPGVSVSSVVNTERIDGCQHKLSSRHRQQRQINRDICTNAIQCSYEETQNSDRCSICQIKLFVVWQPGTYLSLLNNKKCLNKKKQHSKEDRKYLITIQTISYNAEMFHHKMNNKTPVFCVQGQPGKSRVLRQKNQTY